jgi:hypothetical protein
VACGGAVGGEADVEVIVAEGMIYIYIYIYIYRERERERIIMIEKLGKMLVFLHLWT